jgi:hypothetical protein
MKKPTTINIVVQPQFKKRIQRLAYQRGFNISVYVRYVLFEHLKGMKKKA